MSKKLNIDAWIKNGGYDSSPSLLENVFSFLTFFSFALLIASMFMVIGTSSQCNENAFNPCDDDDDDDSTFWNMFAFANLLATMLFCISSILIPKRVVKIDDALRLNYLAEYEGYCIEFNESLKCKKESKFNLQKAKRGDL